MSIGEDDVESELKRLFEVFGEVPRGIVTPKHPDDAEAARALQDVLDHMVDEINKQYAKETKDA